MSTTLLWFRCDLRVRDNPALVAAAAQGRVAAIYIATPRQWQVHDDAPIKLDYWRRNLQALDLELQALGIALHVFEVAAYADIPALLASVLPQWQVRNLHCNREYPLNERVRDQQVQRLCRELGVGMHMHDGQVLVVPERVLNKSGEAFKVFTPFARTLREVVSTAGLAYAALPQPQPVLQLPRLAESRLPAEVSWQAPDSHWESLWPAGEQHAGRQLERFAGDALAHYQIRRDQPAEAGTSQLSPALAAGVVSVRECWRRAAADASNEGAAIWQTELLWRDFYKHVTWHYPHVCKKLAWKSTVGHVPWRHDDEEFAAWCQGRTGIPIIDAAMRQLRHTGWMHNRLRMLTAAFLTKHLLIDWRWGERWFMQHLVDGDFAANNGGWQWSASTGTDAAPYFRIFNPVTQSRRFDPEGTFLRQYLPELAHLDAHEIHAPGLARPAAYPLPIIDLAFGRERALNAFRAP